MAHKTKRKEISSTGDPKKPFRTNSTLPMSKKGQEVHHGVTYKATFCLCSFLSILRSQMWWRERFPFSSEDAVDSFASTRPLLHYFSVLATSANCYISSPCERGQTLIWPISSFGHCSPFSPPWCSFFGWLQGLHALLAFSQPLWWLLFILFC